MNEPLQSSESWLPSPITQLQGIRVTVAGEGRDLLAAADAYESHAQNLDAEAERLRELARQAREQEQNLRMITAVRAAERQPAEAPKLCPRCGSPCTVGTRARQDDTKQWSCTTCTWTDLSG